MLKVMYMLIFVICVLVGVAFLTLLERNVLGYIQIRKGPNKVSAQGILQPISDAIKLFTKENVYPMVSNFLPYYLCPVFGLFLSLFIWVVYPWGGGVFDWGLGLLFVLSVMGMNVYPMLGCGWFSNSKYSLLGCLRSVAQTISYEVSMAIALVSLILVGSEYDLWIYGEFQKGIWYVFMFVYMFVLWIVVMVAETNRTPFDFAEGESELVSGFNVEYSGGGFALIFMAEYSSILFMSMLIGLLFFGGCDYYLPLKVLIWSFMFVFIRGLLPRFRYDKLMYAAWKILLPLSLMNLMVVFCMMWYYEVMNF